MADAKHLLLQVLHESRALLARPDNDFAWSSWKDTGAALSELDAFITAIETTAPFKSSDLSLIFAPTGNMQEVSMSSGWGDHFLEVTARFDSAFAQFQAPQNVRPKTA